MPKMINGAAEASKEMNDAVDDKRDDFENTGEDVKISNIQSIAAVNGTEV